MKRLMLVLTVVLSLALAGNVLADQPKEDEGYFYHTVTGSIKYFKNGHPGTQSQWVPCTEALCGETPDPEPNPNPTGCEGDCYSDWYIEGYSEQMSGVSMIKGQFHVDNNGTPNIDEDDLTVLDSGAMGFANENSNAGYWAEDCNEGCYGSGAIGGAITVGGSSLWGDNNAHEAWMAGLTGSGSIAFLLGSNFYGEVFVFGEGEMGTFAFKENGAETIAAGANSYGNYLYSAEAGGNGPIIGAGGLGLTGGGSYVSVTGNNASAVSGQVTISAAGVINSGNPQ